MIVLRTAPPIDHSIRVLMACDNVQQAAAQKVPLREKRTSRCGGMGNVRRRVQSRFAKADDRGAGGRDGAATGKLPPEVRRGAGAPGAADGLAYDLFSIEFGAGGIGVAALARIHGRDDIDHHLAFRGMAVNLIEGQMLAPGIIAAEELQADLTLIGGFRTRRRIEIIHDQRRRREEEVEIIWDADEAAILGFDFKGADIVINPAGKAAQIRHGSDDFREIAICI